MASDLSSGCTEAIEVLDEKEEGEISLEDVSSSEEGHLNYGYGARAAQCTNCLSTQHNAAWCTVPTKLYHSRGSNRRDRGKSTVQGKENRHQIKDSGSIGTKHAVSTLQEKNDDLVPISSDSDMEIVGLADNSKQIVIRSSSKGRVKKKKKKKRSHMAMLTVDDLVSTSTVEVALPECVGPLMHEINTSSSRPYHREISPVRRTNRPRVTSRSPPRRHRPIVQTHSPFRRSKSPPPVGGRSAATRSPRRLKSPKRSPYKSPPGKTLPRKTSHLDLSSSQSYVETHKLLKKVRHLESIASGSLEETLYKNRENASSLKEKLSHMMKRPCDNNSDMSSASSTRISKVELNDADDEEDLALLRQKALETKQKKSIKQTEQIKTETVKKISIDDDQDEEDLELRMIALRSAVLKKHQTRLQRGIKSGKYRKCNASRSESPFTQSFLDSIPIPGEELLSVASPPHTPHAMMENNHTEDMDLDTDVEREKEKLPYSPTDNITVNISMDTELLGIQPSDVSFINLKNEATSSPSFNTAVPSSQEDQKSYQGKIIENRSYLPNVYYNPPQNAFYVSPGSSMQYSPVHNPRTSILNSNNNTSILETNLNQERPYSPTDAPIYDPDLFQTLPQTIGPIGTSTSSLPALESSYILKSHENNEPCGSRHGQTADEHLVKIETLSMQPNVGSAATSQQGSVSPSSSMVTLDDLPEADVDGSPMVSFAKSIKCEEYIPADATDGMKEPLYMKGIPDVTKDVNKIPTLINRTLVPASILKTNKQLQQPLQTKKTTAPHEPTFKSAEMQPVTLPEDTKANTSFKPMKLMPFPQKSPAVLAIPTVFHDSLHEDPADEQPANEDSSSPLESNNNATSVQSNATAECPDKDCDSLSQKKKRRGTKRKSAGDVQSKAGTNNDNIDILDKRLSAASELEKRTDVENNTDVSNLESPKDSVLGSRITSETNESEAKGKDTLSSDMAEQAKDVDRRQSLDEDEEALRAILLASLPKRAKPSIQSPSNSIANASAASDCTRQIAAAQVAPANEISTANSTMLPTPASSYGSENDRNQSNSSEKASEVAAQVGLPVENVKVLPSMNSGRKRLVPMTKGPQKNRLTKRIPISASTKVVKKYQNAMIQKKLNVQKAVQQYSKEKATESKVAAKVQMNDIKWPTIAKTASETQRIVINLESDTESDSESERRAKKIALAEKQLAVNHTAEFEKNLDQFLRAVRKKQESMAAARPTPLSQIPKKDTPLTTKLENASKLHTPLAVRHLPASQQEEYRRLKQQILEREKLKLHRTAETTNSLKNKTVEAVSQPVPSNSPSKEQNSKINQISSAKSPDLSTQQLNKENCSKSLDSVKNANNNNNALGVERQETASPSQTKAVTKTMANLNICITNEKSSNNVGSKIASPLQSVASPRKVFEIQNEISVKQSPSPGLKILSTDEVNKKFLQIRVQSDMKERMVTIDDKVTLNNTKTVSKPTENASGNKEAVHDQVTTQTVQSVEKEIVAKNILENNDCWDSDASTVALNGQSLTRDDSMDTSESTLRLSQCGESSRLSISPAKSKDDGSPLFKSNLLSNDKRSIEENWDSIKRDVKTELNTLIALPRAEQEQHLMDTEQKLVLKRYTILEDLAEMSGSLRQWNVERDLQTHLVAEVKKLREQLKVAEDRLQMQRNRINSIGPKVVMAHGKINVGRQECFKLATICSSLGSRIIGKEYKVPEAAAQLVDNKLKEVANHTRQLSRKKVPSINLPEAYELTRSDDTVSAVQSDASQTGDLLSVQCGVGSLDNVDNIHETILNKSECTMEESESRDNELEEKTVMNVREVDDQERNITITDSSISNNVENAPQQSNTEIKKEDGETFIDEPDSSNVPGTDTPVSKDSEEPSQKDSPNKPKVTPEPASESCSHDRTSAKLDANRVTRKTIVPYESILVHFKVPRNTNPNGVLCPYELMGTCNDGECQFVHQRESQAK